MAESLSGGDRVRRDVIVDRRVLPSLVAVQEDVQLLEEGVAVEAEVREHRPRREGSRQTDFGIVEEPSDCVLVAALRVVDRKLKHRDQHPARTSSEDRRRRDVRWVAVDERAVVDRVDGDRLQLVRLRCALPSTDP